MFPQIVNPVLHSRTYMTDKNSCVSQNLNLTNKIEVASKTPTNNSNSSKSKQQPPTPSTGNIGQPYDPTRPLLLPIMPPYFKEVKKPTDKAKANPRSDVSVVISAKNKKFKLG